MEIKRLEVMVIDQDGEAVSGARISPRNVSTATGRKPIKRETTDKPAAWNNLQLRDDEQAIAIRCDLPEGYQMEDPELFIAVEESTDPIEYQIQVERLRGQIKSEDEIAAQATTEQIEIEEELHDSEGAEPPEPPDREEYLFTPSAKDPLGSFIQKLRDDVDAIDKCKLCDSFNNLSSQVNNQFNNGWCDDATKKYLEKLKDQFDQLFDECGKIEDEFDEIEHLINSISVKSMHKGSTQGWLYQLGPETLQERTDDWAGRMANLMVAYKGVYDLIHLEVSSKQLPAEVLATLQLEGPFERYQYLQKRISSLSHHLETGPVGACLADLAEECDQAVEFFDDLYRSLELHNQRAPAAAQAITAGLGALSDELKSNCREINGFISQYEADQNAAGLVTAEERLHKLQEGILSLIGELSEAVRLHKLSPAWQDRAEWLAMAKQGLVEAWGGLTGLVQGVHECIEMVESGLGNTWLQYSSGTPQTFQSYVSAAGGDIHAQARLFGQIYTALNQAIAEFRQQTSDFGSAVRDIATFIPLKGDNGGGGGAGGGMDGSAATRKVANAIAAVVGRSVGGDPQAFRAVLAGTFPEDEQTGQIVRDPVRTVVSLAADQGQLAAGQGSLSHEVQLIANDALKVLKGLKSIGSDTDIERAEALTRIVEQELMALKEEAGRVDRPRLSRVQEIFQQLADPGGHLDQLRDELELNSQGDLLGNPDLVTRQEAQLIANMDLLDGYADSLRNTFNRFFATPAGQDPRDGSFSGRLSFVSLLFSVVANSVRTVEEAMDAVDFHQSERRTTFINDPVTGSLISVDGILSWVSSVAVQEGPNLIARSGLIGLNRVLALVNNRLRPLVGALLAISRGAMPAPHPSMQHSRVRNALQQLDAQLGQF
jgi:hypothetical protein